MPNRLQSILENQRSLFWLLQTIGWTCMPIVVFAMYKPWYLTKVDFANDAINLYWESALGLILSLLLRWHYHTTWRTTLKTRIFLNISVLLIVSAIWTAIRLPAFLIFVPWAADYPYMYKLGEWYFGSVSILTIWSTLYFCIKYYQAFEKNKKIAQEAQFLAKDAQLKMLQYQLNPHFLYNTLANISALIQLDENQKAESMTNELSLFLRSTIDCNPNTLVTLEDEIKTIERYLSIEKIRFEDRLSINMDIQETTKNMLIPAFILQPLVENAIKYACDNVDDGVISIRTFLTTENFVIQVIDNGPGLSSTPNTGTRTGIGLANCENRLNAIYGNACNLTLKDVEPNGVCAELAIPIANITKKNNQMKMEDNHVDH